ncbi:MAG: phospholipase A [Burkholderiaceae bacterium]|nr:phospholipase A [Burkholderiaceae bacterium]
MLLVVFAALAPLADAQAGAPAVVSPVADAGLRCAAEGDDRARLACYDRVFRPAPAALPPPLSTLREPARVQPASMLSRFWELDDNDKRSAYVVKTYLPNYLLPLAYTTDINRSPRTPTQSADDAFAGFGRFEAKLQLSLRAKVARDLLIDGADVWFAYTQRSWAQPWNAEDSAPFRTTDHQPEVIYVVPVRRERSALGWRWRMWQLGYTHESNGSTDPLSRSWDRVFIAAGLERGDWSIDLRLNKRLYTSGGDNADISDWAGRTRVSAVWSPGLSTTALVWRNTLKHWDRGSLQLDWSYPVDRAQPAGLRYMVQLFHGYGEALLDYNHRQTRGGLGLALFQF